MPFPSPSSSPVPPSERARLAELGSLEVVDTPAEAVYDGIAEIAAALFGLPYAAVGFIAEDRQWYKARVGVPFAETPRDVSFCAHTIMSAEAMVVEDMEQDPRFVRNPFVVGEPHIRFYAGVPLATNLGECVGTVCVMGAQPRRATSYEIRLLERLARQAVELLEAGRLISAMAAVIERP